VADVAHGSVSPEAVDAKYPISKPRLWLPSLLTRVMVTLWGHVAQLEEHILMEQVVIRTKFY